MTVKLLQEKRAKLIADAREITNKATTESRDLTADEAGKVDSLLAEAEAVKVRIDREARLNAAEGELAAAAGAAPTAVGMSQRDLSSYSLTRAIATMATPGSPRAGIEFEISDEIAKRTGKPARGLYVPFEVQRAGARPGAERRDLTVGTATAGGHMVATNLEPGSFIDLLRNRLIVREAGATMLSGLVGSVAIPKQTGAATAYWVAENGAPTESQQTVGQVTMSPKTVGGFTDFSRLLLLQSTPSIDAMVQNDLARVLALAIDLAALHGTGSSNQPTGIASTAGIGSVAGGTNGLAPAWSHIITLETEVAQDNADIGALKYVSNAKVRGKLKQTEKASSTAQFVWNGTEMNGYPALVSNQVSSTLTKGTSSGVCSAIFFGNWSDLIIGEWGTLDLLVNPYTGADAGTVRVHAFQSIDIAVRRAESFAAMLDALTT